MSELYASACLYARDKHLEDKDVPAFIQCMSEKFAELIVKECVQLCEPILDEPYEDMTEFGKGLVEGQDVAVERIKKHFGVEQ